MENHLLYAFSPTNKKLNFLIPQAKVLHATAFTRYQFINSFRRRHFLASLSKDAAPTFFQEMKPVICKSSLTTVLIVRMICLLFLLLAARSTEYMVDVSVKLKTTVKMILRICYKYLKGYCLTFIFERRLSFILKPLSPLCTSSSSLSVATCSFSSLSPFSS